MNKKLKAQLIDYARLAYNRRLVRGTGGNFSVRIDENQMLITASGVSLGDTWINNILTVNIHSYEWEPLENYVPSKEYKFHADILRLRPDIGSVLHVHPPYATSFAVRCIDIPMVTDAGFKQPEIPRVEFAPSGSEALRCNVEKAILDNPGCKALMLEQHGIIALGRDVVSAYDTGDLIEELAQIAYLAQHA